MNLLRHHSRLITPTKQEEAYERRVKDARQVIFTQYFLGFLILWLVIGGLNWTLVGLSAVLAFLMAAMLGRLGIH